MAELPSGTVTFLLTDVEGSTALWELAPDAMAAALARHDHLFDAAVAAAGGTHIRPRGEGDSRFAVFPSAHDAVAAAIAIQREFDREPWPTPRPIAVRIGIHTGEAHIRDGDYYGSVVNRCARIRGLGHGGQVLLSEVTATLVRDSLARDAGLIDLGEHHLRYLTRPERIFQVRAAGLRVDFAPLVTGGAEPEVAAVSSAAPEQPRPQAPTRLALPCGYPFPSPRVLVNRDEDLAELTAHLERARSSGQLALIGAPAGTGKSTLVGALVKRAEESGFLCLVGACYERGGAEVLSPFQDALADYLLAQEPDVLRRELGSGAADLAYVIPELRYHLELPDPPERGPDDRLRQFGAALHAYLRRLAGAGPILLCLEDLHLADEATIELVRYLAHRGRHVPLLLIGTFRVDEVPPTSPLAALILAARRGSHGRSFPIHQLLLRPFDRDETTQLVHSLLGDPAGAQLRATLYAASEGNPLFVEQLVLELHEEGQLVRRRGEWHQTVGALHQVPGVIGDIIERRLGRVSERCRELLEMAAVLGTTVQHRLLAESLASMPHIDMLVELDEAFNAQLLQATPGGYAFSHALVRETAYWHLSDVRRWRLHAVAGETIERLAGDRVSDVSAELARHFSVAEHLIEAREKAIRYNLEAGRRAAALSSHREALVHFDRACQLLEREDQDARRDAWLEALEGRLNAEWALWLWQPLMVDAERLLQAVDDPARRARARNAVGYARQLTGDLAGALDAFEAGLAEIEAAGDRPDAVVPGFHLRIERGYLWFLEGRFQQMLRQGEELVRNAEVHGQPLLLFWAHNSVGLALMGLGQLDRAVAHSERALAAAERAGDSMRLAVASANLGIVQCFAGEPAAARPNLERAVDLYHEAAADRRAANTVQWLGRALLALGEPEQARRQAELACAYAEESHDRWGADCHDALGMVHALRAEWEAAEANFERALALRATVGHAASKVGSLLGLGLTCERRGRWARARELYQAAVDVAAAMDPSPFEVAARRYLGRLLVLLGDPAGAEQLERAQVLIERMPRSVEHGPMLLALADVNWRGDDAALCEQHAERALAVAPAAALAVEVRLTLARLSVEAGRPERAAAHADEALAGAERLGSPRLRGLARAALGSIAAATGDAARAVAAYEAALTLLEQAGTPFDRALTLLGYGQALVPAHQDGPARARAALAEALELLVAVGARPAAERCRALLTELDG